MGPLEARATELREQVARDRLEIDAELAAAVGTRAAEAALLPTALSDRYETLRRPPQGHRRGPPHQEPVRRVPS